MSLNRQAKQILEDENPSITWLRAQPKESIIQAVLEMKRVYSDTSVQWRRMDHDLAMAQIEIQKLELQTKLQVTSKMIEYGVEIKEHKYGPKAIGDVSSSIANIWNWDEMPKSGSAKLIEDSDLSKRANLAEEQGIVWNLQNKRPERNSTILRKVEAWENGIKRGLEADPAIFCTKDPDDIKDMGPDHKAFMTGLCMQMEVSLGRDPQHRYLVPRFKNIAKEYKKSIQLTAPAPVAPVPVVSPEDDAKAIVTKIYTAWLGSDYRAKIKAKDEEEGNRTPGLPALKNYMEKHVRMVVDMDPEDSILDRSFATEVLWSLTQPFTLTLIKENLDWGTLCGRDPEYIDYSDIYRSYKLTPGRKQVFDDAFEGWWVEMCEREGLTA